MTDQRIREGLRQAVANEPPLRVGMAEIAARARRRAARRRTLLGAGAMTALVAGLATVLPSLVTTSPGGGAGEVPPASGGPAFGEGADPDPTGPGPTLPPLWPSRGETAPSHAPAEYDAVGEIIEDRLTEAFAEHVPDADVVRLSAGDAPVPTEDTLLSWRFTVSFTTSSRVFRAAVTVDSSSVELKELACPTSPPEAPLAADCELFPGGRYMGGRENGFRHVVEARPNAFQRAVVSVEGTAADPAPLSRSQLDDIAFALIS
ncbi:hypothetical protein [Streptomyces litchfieldiae]|uniref:Uncharacterized protein n=1 Tax=Streptomyces litchfieldiae TaxID=3075543 RepID=A0ABU2MV06_9ACTN|nr:hypothetical protein [Streptomyces sp. DSM 44938]MDT0345482.1 hypothetical protein [Streptomyces sp. DSM 44938]